MRRAGATRHERGDLVLAEAGLAQHLGGVLAEQRRRPAEPGVAESFTGIPSPRTVPSSGCSIVTSIPRARVCGSANTSA